MPLAAPAAVHRYLLSRVLRLGVVASASQVVAHWSGLEEWLRRAGVPLEFVVYLHYERLVEDLVAGRLHVAWNSPLGWVRARRLAAARGARVRPLVMQHCDRDVVSLLLARSGSGLTTIADLKGRNVGLGAVDAPYTNLIPQSLLRRANLVPGKDVTVTSFGSCSGLHGGGGRRGRDLVRALQTGEVDAVALTRPDLRRLLGEGAVAAGAVHVVAEAAPCDGHNLTAVDGAPSYLVERLAAVLQSGAADGGEWVDARAADYDLLEQSVDDVGFYDRDGRITGEGYHP